MNKKTVAHYDSVAADYDSLAEGYNKQHYAKEHKLYPANITRVKFILKRFKELKVKSIVECGCGTSYPLITFLKAGFKGKGFDISSEMVKQSKNNLLKAGYSPNLVCQANLEKELPFKEKFDAMMMHGPLMHCFSEKKLLTNANKMLKKGGVLLCEVRNELMSAFSMNEHTYRFFLNLIQADKLPSPIKKDVINFYSKFKGTGKKGSQPWDAKYPTRFHNPFTVNKLFEDCEFKVRKHHFSHYHCLPPIFEKKYPTFYRTQSLKMEKTNDWRGNLMASTFILEAIK